MTVLLLLLLSPVLAALNQQQHPRCHDACSFHETNAHAAALPVLFHFLSRKDMTRRRGRKTTTTSPIFQETKRQPSTVRRAFFSRRNDDEDDDDDGDDGNKKKNHKKNEKQDMWTIYAGLAEGSSLVRLQVDPTTGTAQRRDKYDVAMEHENNVGTTTTTTAATKTSTSWVTMHPRHTQKDILHVICNKGAKEAGRLLSFVGGEETSGTMRQLSKTLELGVDPCHATWSPNGQYMAVSHLGGSVSLFEATEEDDDFLTGHPLKRIAAWDLPQLSEDKEDLETTTTTTTLETTSRMTGKNNSVWHQMRVFAQKLMTRTRRATSRHPSAHGAAFTPHDNGRYLLVCDTAQAALLVYDLEKRNRNREATPCCCYLLRPPPCATQVRFGLQRLALALLGSRPRHLAVHPSGKYVFINYETLHRVSWHRLLQNSEKLSVGDALGYVSTLTWGSEKKSDGIASWFSLNSPSEIACSENGRNVYVSNRGLGVDSSTVENSVLLFHFDAKTETLVLHAAVPTLAAPTHFLLLEEKFLAVASQKTGQIQVFDCNESQEKPSTDEKSSSSSTFLSLRFTCNTTTTTTDNDNLSNNNNKDNDRSIACIAISSLS